MGWGGYPGHPQGHLVLPGVGFRRNVGGILKALERIWASRRLHSHHFFVKVGHKVAPVEHKRGVTSPTCILGALRDGKVRIFRAADVENI